MKLRIKFRRHGDKEWMSSICKGSGLGSAIRSRIGSFRWAIGMFFSIATWKHYLKTKR